MAQCTMPFSVGGTVSGNSQSSEQKSSETIKSSDSQQISGCGDDLPPMEEMVVYGHATSFSWGITFWWSPSPGGNGGGGSGSGGYIDVPVETPQQTGCNNGTTDVQERRAMAGVIYNTEYLYHISRLKWPWDVHARWLAKYGTGKTYWVTWPNGSVSGFTVSGPGTSAVFLEETSCTLASSGG